MALSPLKTQAIRMLARRDYARRELEQRLVAKGAAREELQAVLDELTAAGYLSNERYARAVVTQKTGRLSRRRIADTLKAQGVDAADIRAALGQSAMDDETALRALWQRRFGTPPADDREKARQIRFLQARGFPLAAIFTLLREAKKDCVDE